MGVTTRWWWLRHAPVIDHDGIIYGRRDVPCDVSDKAKFKALAKMLPGRPMVWASSHLKRATDTAAAIVEAGFDPPELIVEPDLSEQSLGDWEGLEWNSLIASKDGACRRFWQDPGNIAPPGGESFADQISRVAGIVRRFNVEYAGADIVVVSHAGTVRAALAIALGLNPGQALSFKVANLSLSRLDHISGDEGNDQWRVAGVNIEPL